MAQESDPPPLEPLVGQVVRDGEAVPGARVTLHRVTPESSGEVASTTANDEGVFRFPLEAVTGAAFNVFFVTADYLSVRYFGPPLHIDQPRTPYTLAVYDTTSTLAEPIRVVRRDMVLIPEVSGSWEVNEVIRILNPGEAALVAGQGMPTWEYQNPAQAGEFQAGEGDILPHEVTRMEDLVMLLTPVTPGERDLFIRYRLPPTPARVSFPLVTPTDTFNLFVRQPSNLIAVEGLGTTRMIDAEGEQYLQYGGDSFEPGQAIVLEWSNAGRAPVDPITAAVTVTVVLLLAGIWGAVRQRGSTAA
jgi:hypothetical protein